jgi:hypothetical protein
MSDPSGRFLWYELLTTDVAAARAFYSQVVGWQATDAKMPGMEYWLFDISNRHVAGLMNLPEESRKMGTPPIWLGYVGVADVDAAAAKATSSGGKVYLAPNDIPNVGRFAVFADPGGAALGLFAPANPEQDQPPSMEERGNVGWHELYAADLDAALGFYGGLFGWQKKEAMDMGEMGVYQTFGTADTALGGIMTKPPMIPVAYWNYYFRVGSIDEAAERVKAAGGQIVHGPQEVPDGDIIVMGVDPQGAGFSLVGSR